MILADKTIVAVFLGFSIGRFQRGTERGAMYGKDTPRGLREQILPQHTNRLHPHAHRNLRDYQRVRQKK